MNNNNNWFLLSAFTSNGPERYYITTKQNVQNFCLIGKIMIKTNIIKQIVIDIPKKMTWYLTVIKNYIQLTSWFREHSAQTHDSRTWSGDCGWAQWMWWEVPMGGVCSRSDAPVALCEWEAEEGRKEERALIRITALLKNWRHTVLLVATCSLYIENNA